MLPLFLFLYYHQRLHNIFQGVCCRTYARRSYTDNKVRWPGVSSLPELREVRSGQQVKRASEENARRSKAGRSPTSYTCKVWQCHQAMLCSIQQGLAGVLSKYDTQTHVFMKHMLNGHNVFQVTTTKVRHSHPSTLQSLQLGLATIWSMNIR